MRKKSTHRGQIFISLLLSLVLMLALSISSSFYMMNEVRKNLIEQAVASNLSSLEKTKNDFETMILDAQSLTNQIILYRNMGRISRMSLPLTAIDRYELYKMAMEFRSYMSVQTNISDFFIYLNNIDMIVSSSIYFSSQFAFDFIYAVPEMDYTNFYEQFLTGYSAGGFSDTLVVNQTNKAEQRCFVCSANTPVKSMSDANIVIMFDVGRLSRSVFAADKAESRVMIIDEKGNYLFGTEQTDAQFIEQCLAAIDDAEQGPITLGSEDYFINYIETISPAPLIYFAITPVSNSLASVTSLMRVYQIGVMAFFTIGLIIAYFLARKNYEPINQLLNYIAASTNQQPQTRKRRVFNESNYIRTVIGGLVRQGELLSIQQVEYMALSRNYYLLQLLHGGMEDGVLSLHFRQNGISMPFERFVVIMISEERGSNAERSKLFLSDPVNCFLFKEMLIQQVSSSHICYMAEYKNNVCAMIVNIRNKADDFQVKNDLVKAINLVCKEFDDEEAPLLINCYFGSIQVGMGNVKVSCRQAEEMIGYKKSDQLDRMVFYDDVKDIANRIFYPVDAEEKLVAMLSAGNTDGALMIINGMWNSGLSLFEAQCTAVLHIGTIIKQLGGIDVSQLGVLDIHQATCLLESCQSVQSVLMIVTEIITKVCAYANAQSSYHIELRKGRIERYINDHFHESNLNQAQIAGEFNITPSY